MAQRSVEILLGRLITDEAFRSAFRKVPGTTLTRYIETGHDLTPLEITALRAMPAGLWERIAEQIDPRLQKMSFEEEL